MGVPINAPGMGNINNDFPTRAGLQGALSGLIVIPDTNSDSEGPAQDVRQSGEMQVRLEPSAVLTTPDHPTLRHTPFSSMDLARRRRRVDVGPASCSCLE